MCAKTTRGIKRPRASGITGVCEPADVGTGASTWVILEHQVLLTPEPSLHPWPHNIFRNELLKERRRADKDLCCDLAIVKLLSTRNVSIFTLVFFVSFVNLADRRYNF